MSDLSTKFSLVMQHMQAGRHEQARLALQRILQQSPNHPDANNGMAVALMNLGQKERAIFFARRAAELAPNDPVILNTLGTLLNQTDRPREAIPVLERAVGLNAAFEAAHQNLANSYWSENLCTKSVAQLRACLAAKPETPDAIFSLANKLTLLARAPEAVQLCASAVAKFPHHLELARSLCTSTLNDPGATPVQSLDAARAVRIAMNAVCPTPARAFSNPRDPDRRLRVGLVSPDFRGHSVSYYIEPILERIDRSAFHVICYSNNSITDETTKRIKALVPEFRQVESLTDGALCARVIEDRVDVLIDLAGHTVGAKIGAFHLAAAPVQVTYCGYPATTGLPSITHRLVDSLTDPPGSDDHAVEKLVRIDPCFLCYRPAVDAPPTAPPPSITSGRITFGSFNASSKINDRLLSLWSRLLNAVPGSSLLLKAICFADAEFRDDIAARLESMGVSRDRVEMLGPTKSTLDHLSMYSRVDVALDTFPYHGTTTTCEAMWMGVPVVTLAGTMHVSRVGVSLLSCTGMGELIARDEDEYVRLASGLAADTARLAALRLNLRERLLASPLMDSASFTRRFESAIRDAWRAWCAGGPSSADAAAEFGPASRHAFTT